MISGEVWRGGRLIPLRSLLLFPFICTANYGPITFEDLPASPKPLPQSFCLFSQNLLLVALIRVCDPLVRFETAVSRTCSYHKIQLFQIGVEIFAASVNENLPLPAFLLEKV